MLVRTTPRQYGKYSKNSVLHVSIFQWQFVRLDLIKNNNNSAFKISVYFTFKVDCNCGSGVVLILCGFVVYPTGRLMF